jgi:hypothetical protein
MRAWFAEMTGEQREIERSILNIMWHMRGSLSREEAWTLSPREQNEIRKYIAERLKIVEKTNLPLL